VRALLHTYRCECRPIRDRRVRSQKHHEIGEIGDSYSEVGGWRLSPYILQISSLETDYGKVRGERCVEAGCTDHDIEFVALAFVVDAAVCVEGCHASFDYADIFFLQGLKGVSGIKNSCLVCVP
jgi:hypothetical protein